MSTQHEVTTPQKLLTPDGTIGEPGFARSLIWEYNREEIKAGKLRIKEWDYYIVTSKDFCVAFTLSDLGFAGMISVSFIDIKNKQEITKTVLKPLTLGKLNMPRTSKEGDISFENKQISLHYTVDNGNRHILCQVPDFEDGKPFSCDICLEETLKDTMVIATPWKENPTRFYYNQKINCMRASGTVTFGETYSFDPDLDFGTLDWGRGVWTYDNRWFWATGNALIDGKPFGFNLGYGFSDRSSASENMIFYDGEMFKLNEVEFRVQQDIHNNKLYMKPWKFTSSDGRFEGDFTPILDRVALIRAGILVSDQHQLFGYLRGFCKLNDGTILIIKDMFCSTEDVHNKY